MSADPIFISHASSDDAFMTELRQKLEGQGLCVWVDSRNLRGGAKLATEIESAIEQARQVIVLLSPETVNSAWVRKEIQQALQVERRRKDDGYRVIPLLLPGIRPSALGNWFDEEPLAIPMKPDSPDWAKALIVSAHKGHPYAVRYSLGAMTCALSLASTTGNSW